jgi:hypothetical protein
LNPQIIEVIVATDGKVTVQTKGFTGSACKAASESLEKALGLKQSDKPTSEFYSQQTNQQHAKEGQA